jgi:hypothetical protein
MLRACLDWLSARPCPRQSEPITRLPFEDAWLLGPLSDSTICSGQFTTARLLLRPLDGAVPERWRMTPTRV